MKNINTLSLVAAQKLFIKAREQYYNSGNSELTDQEFDALEDRIRAEAPKWEPLHSTGISVPKKFEVALDKPMPSLDKIKSDEPAGVERWLKKVAKPHLMVHISEKIDGSSIQCVWKRGVLKKMATRGDGLKGKDISGFIPYVNIPREVEDFAKYPTVVVRFEATIPLSVYNKRYQGTYDSDRAMASAILNRQDVSPALRHIEFVALRILNPVLDIRTSQDMLKGAGFLTPRSKVVSVQSLTTESLAQLAANVKSKSEYSTDGLVIFTCSEDPEHLDTEDRPEFARAFKLNDLEGAVETEIIDIQWNPSSFGVVVPKAIVKPVKFGNVTVKQAALHNAAWAKERGAGVGAKVKLIRSGEIIPKIVEVIQPAKLMIPLEKGTWYWDETKTNVVLKNPEDNPEVLAKKFTRFFGKLELEDVAGGLAAKLVTAGYTNTAELCRLKKTDFAALPGIKASAGKIFEQIARVQNGDFDVISLMVASGCFDKGLGETRLKTLWKQDTYFFNPKAMSILGRPEFLARAAAVKGFGPAAAEIFAEGIQYFWKWVKASGAKYRSPEAEVVKPKVEGPLTNLKFSWTGYRSKEEEAFIQSQGGEVVDFNVKKTNVLFYRVGGKKSSKVEKAMFAGISAMEFEQYKVPVKKKVA